jgi:hypothetical protein
MDVTTIIRLYRRRVARLLSRPVLEFGLSFCKSRLPLQPLVELVGIVAEPSDRRVPGIIMFPPDRRSICCDRR